ncbi:hypothetical protein HXX76_010366 [Chlamydomonas incerta]|uniref:Meiotic nuclear division protein 1 homolog n=1 Tax=Chlamydomonas incerta TaxID=51695 RepID=A0A835SNH3_CHLIN|nr:hypothetical protein HXX76_010366 [Chlamydomonas incerta]|eukprot:KAG2430269.1 hypothetical protein HXX76_010366 [Chlamydomonas incerta]
MPPKKGVSAAEKRDRVLEIFHESSDVFQGKDIEKLATKKGVISQAVKDVLQSLVDDNLVHMEKIGISNYFWAFPSEASVMVENDVKRLEADLSTTRKRRAEVEAALEQHKAANPDTESRALALAELNKLKKRAVEVSSKLEAYRDNDPETVQAMHNMAESCKLAANRWLDNTYSLLSWCKKRFAGNEAELAKFFEENGLDEKVEYLE